MDLQWIKCSDRLPENEIFERDLKNVLYTLEKLLDGNVDHVHYIRAYQYFVNTWSPKKIMKSYEKS